MRGNEGLNYFDSTFIACSSPASVTGYIRFFMIWLITTPGGFPWFLFPAAAWGIGLAAHATAAYTSPVRHDDELEPGESPHRQLGR